MQIINETHHSYFQSMDLKVKDFKDDVQKKLEHMEEDYTKRAEFSLNKKIRELEETLDHKGD